MLSRSERALIPDETISQIRNGTDIVALVGEYVPLKKSGASFKGLCPFHPEKTPSFYVHPQRGFFHCFGCAASGDVVTFVMRLEGIPFPDAARRLAERAGIELPRGDAREDFAARRAKERNERLYAIMDAAAGFYIAQLREHPLGAMGVEAYRARGIGDDTAATFRLGYAPEGWDALATFLRGSEHSMDEAVELGLVVPRRGGDGHYDRFRHRLVFPIADVHGRIVAFSGRVLPDAPGTKHRPDAEPPPKYVNSPESPLYTKGEILYGLHEGRVTLRREGTAILCEGNFDLVALHQSGFGNAVAPMGTALTAEQAQLLRRFVEKVVLLFDGDRAGRKAVGAAYTHLQRAGLTTFVVTLPEGEDPDSFLRAKGADALRTRVQSAPGIVHHLIDRIAADAGADPKARALGIAELGPVIAAVDNPIEGRLYIERIGQKFGVGDLDAVRKQLRTGIRAARQGDRTPEMRGAPSNAQKAAPISVESPGLAGELLGALLDQPELLESDAAKNLHDLLTRDDLRAILQLSTRMFRERRGIDAASLLQASSGSSSAGWLARRLATQVYDLGGAETALRDGIPRLARQNIERELPRLQQLILEARRHGDEERARFLTEEYVVLTRNAHKLKLGSTSKR